MPDEVDGMPSDDVNKSREIQNEFGNAVHGAGRPTAVSVPAEVWGDHPEIPAERLGYHIPAARMVAASVQEEEIRLAVVSPVPEMELEPVGVVILRYRFHAHPFLGDRITGWSIRNPVHPVIPSLN